MSEVDLIERTHAALGRPVTPSSLLNDFRNLGVREGDTLLVHCSLSSIGWVCGGAQAVLEALFAAIGPEGVLAMPSQSGHLSDPAEWRNPPVPESWKSVIRAETPAYDPNRTPTRDMGAVAELFRSQPGVLRSAHPVASFAAFGSLAESIVGRHALDEGVGEGGPLARLYESHARILLIGCGYGKCTSLHLAEHNASWPGKGWHDTASPVLEDGQRLWRMYRELDYNDEDFAACGAAFEKAVAASRIPESADRRPAAVAGKVGLADCRHLSQRSLVDFAVSWFETNRGSADRNGSDEAENEPPAGERRPAAETGTAGGVRHVPGKGPTS